MDGTIGKISHYFDRIQVAALKLTGPLAVGDTVVIRGHGAQLPQLIKSMQIERKEVQKAKSGDDVAIKVDAEVKEGDEVVKV